MSSCLGPDERRWVFVAGKDVVGKTTVAAATVREPRAAHETLLLPTDPAAHTGLLLGASVAEGPVAVPEVRHPTLARSDPQAARLATRRLREELNSPCREEVVVFRRCLRPC